jgi:hypothetical protein
MTSVTDFRAQFQAAMTTLYAVSPGTHAYVTSIPDAYQLWSLFKGNWWARFIWSAGGVCQSLLANATSTQQVDVERRAFVRQRNIDFNTQLREVCALFPHCRFDNNAVFNTQFTRRHRRRLPTRPSLGRPSSHRSAVGRLHRDLAARPAAYAHARADADTTDADARHRPATRVS